MNRSWQLVSTLAIGLWCTQVSAIELMVDPGPVGTSGSSYSLPFSDLNETPLIGQDVSLDIVFDDMKHVETVPLDRTSYRVALKFSTDGVVPSLDDLNGTAYLTDGSGEALFSPAVVIVDGVGGSSPGWQYFFDTSMADAIVHHGVHFDVVLPSIDSSSIDSASLLLNTSPAARIERLITVGTWTPATSVAEPAAILPLLLGLFGFGFVQRRLQKKRLS